MKRSNEPHAQTLRSLVTPERLARFANGNGITLLQVHPVPQSRDDIVRIATHLVNQFAAAHAKTVPGLSEEAAAFLADQRWGLPELASRLARAVFANRGSLITAADLSEI